jgi:predicted MFS family arabinose efflux permease
MYFGLALFALGSFICASSDLPWIVIVGRILQGAGAISAVAIAAAADLTRDSQRTKAMAIIGSTIGVVFAVSFIVAPYLERSIGMHGIFAMTGGLAIAAILVVRFVVPDAPVKARERGVSLGVVFRDPELVRLNIGIFALHAVLMAMFVVVPIGLVNAGLPAGSHHWIYLGAVGTGFVLMLPAVVGPWAQKEKTVFVFSIALVAIALATLTFALSSLAGIAAALVIFFTGFNVLEAKLPALVSKAAPREAVGSATGIYSSVQFLGTFVGGAAGGAIAQHAGFVAVLACCLALTLVWLAAAWNMGEFVVASAPRN